MQIDANQIPDPILHNIQFLEKHPIAFRVINLALPLLVMVPRARFFTTMGLGGYQIYCLSRDCKGSKEAIRLGYVTSMLGLQAFRPDIAAVIQTLVELSINGQEVRTNPEKGKASLRLARSMLDTLALRWGGTSLLLGAMTIQIILELIASKDEFKQGRILEGFAHLLFAAIRGYQLVPHVKQAKREWFGRELTQENLQEILKKQQLQRMKRDAQTAPPPPAKRSWFGRGLTQEIFNGLIGLEPPPHEERFDFNKILEEGNYKSSLRQLNFSGGNLSEMDFRNVQFDRCDFSNGNFTKNFFDRVTFQHCKFEGAIFNDSHFRNSQFLDSNLRNSYLHSCHMRRIAFERCDLFEASFFLARAQESRLLDCQLTDCLLLDSKKDFKIIGGTPHRMTRPVVGMSWDFKKEGFGAMSDTISHALKKEGVILLHVESSPDEVDPLRLEKEFKDFLSEFQEGMNLPQELLKNAKEGSEIAKFRQRAGFLLEHIDAFVLPGGVDIEPELYGAPRHPKTHSGDDLRRSMHELAFLQAAQKRDRQVLGICRGAQMINVFHGGTLEQHVEGHFGQYHQMENRSSNPIAQEVIGKDITGLSMHHQTMKKIGQGLEVILEAGGVPKLVMNKRFLASQFHPEAYLWMDKEEKHRETNRNIFRYLMGEAKKTLDLKIY